MPNSHNDCTVQGLGGQQRCLPLLHPMTHRHCASWQGTVYSALVQVCTLELITEPVEGAGQPSKRLIGLARATSDHVFNATVWDVLVDPEFQNQACSRRCMCTQSLPEHRPAVAPAPLCTDVSNAHSGSPSDRFGLRLAFELPTETQAVSPLQGGVACNRPHATCHGVLPS